VRKSALLPLSINIVSSKLRAMEKLCQTQCCDPLEAYNRNPCPQSIRYLTETCHPCLHLQLKAYIRSKVKSVHDAEDIYQQSWTNFLTRLHSGRPIKNVKAYLYKVADNIIKKKSSSRPLVLGEVPETLDFSSLPPEDGGDGYVNMIAILKSLLTPREYEVFVIKISDPKVKNEDISALLGISKRRVENLTAAARSKAKVLLQEKYPDFLL
jgi:RNA polymerase sigma factor (sigma-70 family)